MSFGRLRTSPRMISPLYSIYLTHVATSFVGSFLERKTTRSRCIITTNMCQLFHVSENIEYYMIVGLHLQGMIHIQRKQLPGQHSYRSDGPALVDHNKAWSLCMLADINLLIQNKYTDNETSDGAFI